LKRQEELPVTLSQPKQKIGKSLGSNSRRPGDPDKLIAASDKAEELLGWKRQYDSIDDIVASAWNFHQKNANGFASHK
jgi:UDP-glucose 4-epimerase